jgi:hypothetical protein
MGEFRLMLIVSEGSTLLPVPIYTSPMLEPCCLFQFMSPMLEESRIN